MLPIRNVTYTKCYLYEMLSIRNVTYTKCYLYKVYYTKCYQDEMLLYENVLYEMLLIPNVHIASENLYPAIIDTYAESLFKHL